MKPRSAPPSGLRVAVIGGGWAGMAAAMAAVEAGHAVTVYEAARTLGGRARSVPLTNAAGETYLLDNGQHILIGAYVQTLALMRKAGVNLRTAFLRQPLDLRFPGGDGICLPRLPAPVDVAMGILRARGWRWSEKKALLRVASEWRRNGFVCDAAATVADVCRGLPARVIEELIDPLCVSALNTPANAACGQVFLRVLNDALFSVRGGSHLLVPRLDLGTLFPDAAAAWLQARQAAVLTGHRVQNLTRAGTQWQVDSQLFDRVIVACAPWEAARLVAQAAPESAGWAQAAEALRFESIATVYCIANAGLPRAMLALRNTADAPAQFVFDRGHLGGPHGLLAFVVSASDGDREELQEKVLRQALDQLGSLGIHFVQPLQTVVEKRATFACTPALDRPAIRVAPGLLACGDYVEGPYPATLEGAVRSALEAASQLSGNGA
ncbi:hydroxysqualene dehydroxylase HpnE [Variovorax sp. VNK109]|uniref:hydroxysqualene dehydroxylase HpnE n=1 Tax=Variovorax sp. VNK109 TaxID=3400919 RepID=UPI003BFBC7C0